MPSQPVELFFSYSHKDEELREELETHLAMLRNEGVIRDWHDRKIAPGQEWDGEIDEHLNGADIILLLASPDFLASQYCYDIEVQRAMARHEAGEACVIPVILRPCEWQRAPFSKLQALPTGTIPITRWPDRDEAFLDVTEGIRRAVEKLLSGRENAPRTVPPRPPSPIPRPPKVGFVRRHDESRRDIVKHLQDELSPHKNQLVALWGAGGVGKTTLAAEAARELDEAGRYVVWVTADGRANFTFSTLLDDIAEQFGRIDLRPLVIERKEEAVRGLIAVAPTLIVLDNFETIPPAEQPPCLTFLAKRAECPALITTREAIEDVHSVPLRPMLAEEGKDLLDKLIEQTSSPDIYTDANRTRILETAEYNPLVVQWIVGQINLAQGPDEVLSELAHGEGKAAERVFDRSFNLPQTAEGGRAVLLALSLFMPSATRPALAEVAGMAKDKYNKKFRSALRTLASLWLIKPTDGGQRVAVEGLTREFAKSRLSRDPRSKPFRQRFVSKFLRFAQANSDITAEHLNSTARERENILNAMDVAFELRDYESMFSINQAIWYFLDVRGYWDEAIQRGDEALKVARQLVDERWISLLTHNLAIRHQNRGNMTGARQLYDESLEIKRRLGNEKGIAITLNQLGRIAQRQGDLVEARRLYNESLELEKKFGDQRGIAITLHQLGVLALAEGELAETRRLYKESLEIEKRLGHQGGMAISLRALGLLAEKEGNKTDAAQLFREALRISLKLGMPMAEKLRGDLDRIGKDLPDEGS